MGPWTPPEVMRATALGMTAAGCRPDDIALVLGISRDRVRRLLGEGGS